jgi:hypothetical protein
MKAATEAMRKWTTAEGWRSMLARAHRPELEQAVLRVVLVGLVYVYVLWTVHRDGSLRPHRPRVRDRVRRDLRARLILLLRVISAGGQSNMRRALGMLADNARRPTR